MLPLRQPGAKNGLEGLTLFLILRSFAAGCSAVTGMEVISNGVKAFRHPESKNAASDNGLDVGDSRQLSSWVSAGWPTTTESCPRKMKLWCLNWRVSPSAPGSPTMWSRWAPCCCWCWRPTAPLPAFRICPRSWRGTGSCHTRWPHSAIGWCFQTASSFSGSSPVCSLVIFQGDTHALIPLYAIGVFVSFTLSQAGMVRRWLVKKGLHWRKKLIVNGIGAVTTGIATVIIASHEIHARRLDRLPPRRAAHHDVSSIRHHYKAVAEQVALTRDARPPRPRRNLVIIPIGAREQGRGSCRRLCPKPRRRGAGRAHRRGQGGNGGG